jgi:quercetin dioxygenase-like cupin family protein
MLRVSRTSGAVDPPESTVPDATMRRQTMQATTARRFPHIPAGTGETYDMYGELLTFKVTSAETNGTFAVIELHAQPGGGPPLHTHPSAETFTILEGAFAFTGLEGGEEYTIQATAGDTVFIPGGVPHTYRAVGDTPGRTLLVLTPGEEMERFFTQAGVRVTERPAADADRLAIPAMLVVAQQHGLAFLPPRPEAVPGT